MNSSFDLDIQTEHGKSFSWVFLIHSAWFHSLLVVVNLFRTESIAESIFESFRSGEYNYLSGTEEVDLISCSITCFCGLKRYWILYEVVQIHHYSLLVGQTFEFITSDVTVPIEPVVRHVMSILWVQLVELIVSSCDELFEVRFSEGCWTFTFILDFFILSDHVVSML